MIQIRLLGGVSASTEDGTPLEIGSPKCQAVLAVLALSAGSAVPVTRVVDLVWGAAPPRTADKTLQSYASRLRQALGPDSIARIGSAYRLDIPPEAVDATRFQRHLDAGDTEAALAEWGGTPLAGLDAEGLAGTVAGLTERWLGALEVDLDRQIELDAAAAVGSLTEVTAAYPFREGFWASLMTALYRTGRQADALAAYHRARQQLLEHLGVEPGPRLRELESLILGQDDRLQVARSSRGSALGPPTGTVTFGFVDVEGSTRLWATHRQEMATALARHDEAVRASVERQDGYIFATGGDSFGIAFHRARDAVAWASELQSTTRRNRSEGVPIRVRIGLHSGETEERGKGYFGPAVIVAARLTAAGHGGQTLVSGVTTALLDGNGLRDLGTFRLDGVLAEQRVFQLGHGDFPPLRTEDSQRGNLPRRLGRLIGRDADLTTISDALAAAPIVTLVGPGGIGKTRLGIAAARRAEAEDDGAAWLIELANIASSADVARTVAGVLNVTEGLGRSITQSIVSVLQARRALLVLDNCEHVIEGAAELARAIAEGCPDIRILATSREGLGLRNEQLIVVSPLEPAGPGVELFNERAAAASQDFDAAASRPEVVEICRRLDGVPLAIELAAARTSSLSPTELVARLDDRLRLLTGGRRTSVERHRTLRATIEWSYDLLSAPEQTLFQRLSIFAGPFDLPAAEAVAAEVASADRPTAEKDPTAARDRVEDSQRVDELLGNLVDRSMLIVESGPVGRRFRMLETMRQFAAEHLRESGDTDRIAERHASWSLQRVTAIRPLLAAHAEIEGAAQLDELWPNLRAAVDWACGTGNRQLAHALISPIAAEVYLRSRTEIGDWAERILAITPPEDGELIEFGVTWAARRYMRNLDREGYERLVARHGEPDRPMIHYARAFVYSNPADMLEWAPRVMADLRAHGEDDNADRFEVAGLGVTLLMNAQLPALDTLGAQLVDRYRTNGPPTCLNWALTLLGYSASYQGRHDEARKYFDDSISVTVPERTHSLNNPRAAWAALERGNQALALELLRDYINGLIENDNMYLASIACAEFTEMLVAIDQLIRAAPIVAYLRSPGRMESPALLAQIATAAQQVEAASDGTPTPDQRSGEHLNHREALAYMRDTLDHLVEAEPRE